MAQRRSHVFAGDEGVWRGTGLAFSDPAPHEFGHLVGLDDRYYGDLWAFLGKSGPKPGWAGNIMAEPPGFGAVQQKNIDAILDNALEDYSGSQIYQTEIDEALPTW